MAAGKARCASHVSYLPPRPFRRYLLYRTRYLQVPTKGPGKNAPPREKWQSLLTDHGHVNSPLAKPSQHLRSIFLASLGSIECPWVKLHLQWKYSLTNYNRNLTIIEN